MDFRNTGQALPGSGEVCTEAKFVVDLEFSGSPVQRHAIKWPFVVFILW